MFANFATRFSPMRLIRRYYTTRTGIPAPQEQSAEERFQWFSKIAWEAPLTSADLNLLNNQETYVAMVREGRADEAFKTFKRTNKTNVGTALFMLGWIKDDDDLTSRAYRLLKDACVAIAYDKGLRNHYIADNSVWGGPLDKFIMEFKSPFKTPLDTARLLLLNRHPALKRHPNGGIANYSCILGQRLTRALGYSQERVTKATQLLNSFGAPDVPYELVEPSKSKEGFEWHSLEEACRLVETVEALKRGLTYHEISLWQAAADQMYIPSLHWGAIALEFADPRTGDAPSADAIRKQWARLRARLRRKYMEITGRESIS